MVKVKLHGLNITKSRGKFYVYDRATGQSLVRCFDGTKADLVKHLSTTEFMAAYNAARRKHTKSKQWPTGSLGDIITWYRTECPKYKSLAESTKREYDKAFLWLEREFDYAADDITQADLYDTRDKCAIERSARFADHMIAALSSAFSQAVKRRKMRLNPALGMDKLHKADKNANREWTQPELAAALAAAPEHLKTVLLLARYAGFRGQTIAALGWHEYQDDPNFGKCFRTVAKKNNEALWIPATKEIQDHLETLDKTALKISTRMDGRPWDKESQMQTEVSHFLRTLEAEGKIGAGTTLHGLRVTYAASLRRSGATASDVAAALGDSSERMGEHYTRHVEKEARVVSAFKGRTLSD